MPVKFIGVRQAGTDGAEIMNKFMAKGRFIDNQLAFMNFAQDPDLVLFGIEIAQYPVFRHAGVIPFEFIGIPDNMNLEPIAHLNHLVKLGGGLELIEAAEHVKETLIIPLRRRFREAAGNEKRRESRQAHQPETVVSSVRSAVHF